MNVLMIANIDNCYGANRSLLDMLLPLRERGIEIIVLVQGNGTFARELRKRKIVYYIVPYRHSAAVSASFYEKFDGYAVNWRLLKDAERIVRQRKIDLIHTNASNVDFGALLSMVCNIPHVWHIRELLKEDYKLTYHFPKIEKYLMKRADCLIAISKYVAEQREISGKGSIVLYDGLDIDKYAIDKTQLFSGDVVNILYCGVLTREKGVMDAIRAVNKIVVQGYSNFRLDIVGEKNKYYMELARYVRVCGIQKYVCFHGYQVDLKPFREKADIALMCSRGEALGRVTVESMLGECFVIGAHSGGTLELIRENETGYFYEAGDAGQLAQKILLVIQDIEQSKKIVKRAKDFACRRFDNRKYAEKLLRIYEMCIRKYRGERND